MKKNSASGMIWGILSAIVVLGFLVAVLSHFNWDAVAAFQWAWDGFWHLVGVVAGFFERLFFSH